jgi:pseudaminic acid synthase
MAEFSIGDKRIGDDAPVYFVAELSANHGNRLDRALQAVEAAAKAGADAIKLQTYTPDTLTLRSSAPPFVVKTKNEWAGRTLHDLYAEAMTPWEWHKPIKDAAASFGMACFSTPFDASAVQFLAELEVPAWKVASFELTDLPLVELIARQHQPIILSTGMASLADIEAAVMTCFGVGNRDLALLRCVSAYPASPSAMDLRSFDALRSFGVVLGLSDHTTDNVAAVAAVALGARFIEKHFIVDRSWGGPDAFFSLEPDQFKRLIADVRACEASLGKPRFGPSADEMASCAFRRSLFVARDVAPGATLTADDVRSVRPANGLPARHLPEVLGRTAQRALSAAEPLAWDMVGPAAPGPLISLRPATLEDAAILRAWRNDRVTRANSRTQGEVNAEEHLAWLRATLLNPDRRLLVAVNQDRLVGQIRLDKNGSSAEISVTVAPDSRGRGFACSMLRMAEQVARDLGVSTLLAEIHSHNQASIKSFKRAGFYSFVQPGGAGNLLRCERRIVGFHT